MLPFFSVHGAIAKRLCSGLQIRPERFDSASRLHRFRNVNIAKRRLCRRFSFLPPVQPPVGS
jgi:hypothetical protein